MSSDFLTSFFGTESKPKRKRQIVKESKNKEKKRVSKKTELFPQPKGSIKYKDYYFVNIKKSKTAGKKLDAVYNNVKTGREKIISFGNSKVKDYTQHKNREQMEFYDFKYKRKENWNDLMSVGALNKYVLWSKPSLEGGIREYKKKLKGPKKKV